MVSGEHVNLSEGKDTWWLQPQNSALGAFLAMSHFADPLTVVPCAISACIHSVMGSAIAGAWRWSDIKRQGTFRFCLMYICLCIFYLNLSYCAVLRCANTSFMSTSVLCCVSMCYWSEVIYLSSRVWELSENLLCKVKLSKVVLVLCAPKSTRVIMYSSARIVPYLALGWPKWDLSACYGLPSSFQHVGT